MTKYYTCIVPYHMFHFKNLSKGDAPEPQLYAVIMGVPKRTPAPGRHGSPLCYRVR